MPFDVRSAMRGGARGTRARDAATEAQELWFAATRFPWSTLALVPAHEGGSALSVAHTLVQVSAMFRRRQPELISAEGIELATASGWIFQALAGSAGAQSMQPDGRTSGPDRFERVVALEPVMSNPMGVAIARAADAVLLVVETGISDFEGARWTLETIGRNRFLGCVLVSPT
jgi:hypothetical protein